MMKVSKTSLDGVLTITPPTVFEDGCQFRDYVDVHDVTDANILVMEK